MISLKPQVRTFTIDADLIEEILDFLDDHSDVRDGSYGEPMPNRAMSLHSELLRELGR